MSAKNRPPSEGATVKATVAALLVAVLQSHELADGAPARRGPGPFGRLTEGLRDRMLDVVGPDDIVERVDPNAVLKRVDVNALLDRVDVNRLLAQVDVDQLLERVDVDTLLDRIDVNALLDRVDVNRLTDRIDPERLLDRVDVESLVQRAGIPDIVAQSTSSIAESALDLLRRELLALDVVFTRGVMRLRRRDPYVLPAGPTALAGDGGPTHSLPAPNAPVTDVTGHYAGPVTRLVAHVLDVALASALFALASSAISWMAQWMIDLSIQTINRGGVLFVLWLFTYWWGSTAVAGRTPGMAAVGLRVVARDGEPLSGGRAFLRVITLPFSFLFAGLGLLGTVFSHERRALHDVVAGSTVVYDWGDRKATLPTPLARWLARHAAPIHPDDGAPRHPR